MRRAHVELYPAETMPLMVSSSASLDELNSRLAQREIAAVGIERFRPNIVLADTDAFEEDYVAQLSIGSSELRLVKPCVRCSVPNVDPGTGESSSEPGDTLALFRDNARAGGVTFGMTAIVTSGAGAEIARGAAVEMRLAL